MIKFDQSKKEVEHSKMSQYFHNTFIFSHGKFQFDIVLFIL